MSKNSEFFKDQLDKMKRTQEEIQKCYDLGKDPNKASQVRVIHETAALDIENATQIINLHKSAVNHNVAQAKYKEFVSPLD